MTTTTSLLDGIQIAKPCTADWDEMKGDERVRHCGSCKLDVYNLSSMRRDEAEAFVAGRTGKARTCIRFYRRADGTMLTQDCPVGVRAAWKKMTWAAAALLAGGFAAAAMLAPRGAAGVPQIAPLKQIYEFVQTHFYAPVPAAPMGAMPVRMGDFAAPPAPTTPAVPTMGKMPTPTMGECSVPTPTHPAPPVQPK